MNSFGERISALISELGITKTSFADRLNITQPYVSKLIKNGTPSDRLIEDICEKFNVREEWIRTGEGEMFSPLDRQDQIANLTATLFKGEKNSFKERLILALAGLDENEWEMLEKIAEKIAKEKD